MRNLLLFTIFVIEAFGLSAQDHSWEIGWQLYNSHPLPTAVVFVSSPGPSFLNGIWVKHRLPEFKQRMSIQYLDLTAMTGMDICCDFPTIENRFEGIELKMGIEKSIFSGPLECYAVFDIGFGLGQFLGSSSGGFIGGRFQQFNLRYRSIGAYPGGGVNWRIKKRVAINWELCWPGVFYKTRGAVQPGFGSSQEPAQGNIWQKKPESTIGVLLTL